MVGTWNSTSPDGTQSVGDNRVPMQENTTYIKDNMQLDHYWAEGADEDGHHRYVQSPKVESGGDPADPTLDTGMDGVAYFKEKTAAESTVHQPTLPFFKDSAATPAVLEMLGIRAMVHFTGSTGVVQYSHNVTGPVTVNGAGDYTVTFTNALPSANYLVISGGTSTGSTINTLSPISKGTGSILLKASDTGKHVASGWVACFGG